MCRRVGQWDSSTHNRNKSRGCNNYIVPLTVPACPELYGTVGQLTAIIEVQTCIKLGFIAKVIDAAPAEVDGQRPLLGKVEILTSGDIKPVASTCFSY